MSEKSNIPADHPRAHSLRTRELMKDAVAAGLVHPTGLIAHGRGEAFDYLLGERTPPEARVAIDEAARLLVAARQPVLSLNGNVVALAAHEAAQLHSVFPRLVLEVNLFHRTPERVALLVRTLRSALHAARSSDRRGGLAPASAPHDAPSARSSGLPSDPAAGPPSDSPSDSPSDGGRSSWPKVLGEHPDARIPGLTSDRALCSQAGIAGADVVLVPLEDGDRAQALKAMGKTVITIDLNPLSRTARCADVTIVDELTRAIPHLTQAIANLLARPAGRAGAGTRFGLAAAAPYDNRAVLQAVQRRMCGLLEAPVPP